VANPTHIPPKLATRLLHSFLRNDFAEEVQGDLEEKFYSDIKDKSALKAKINYWFEVLNYLRPFAIRKSRSHLNQADMYRNYFKTALRNTLKNKVYSFLNISGLSVGMAVTLLIGLWMWNELTFDKKSQENYSRIARIIQNVSNNGEVQTWWTVPFPLAEEIRKNYSDDYDYVVMSSGQNSNSITIQDKKTLHSGVFIEPDAPHLFALTMIAGTRNGLVDQHSVLISQSMAIASFGAEDPINKTMQIGDDMQVKVTGVYKDFPDNSSFQGLEFMAAWELLYNDEGLSQIDDPWRPNFTQLFVKLKDNINLEDASLRIRDEKMKHLNNELAKKKPELFLFPMSKWYLYSEFQNGVNTGGRIQYVWMFGIIGGFILLLACINFMNLCTARSERRAKEIGIRKSVGSNRSQLINQFFSESFFMVLISFIVALLLAQLMLPFFNEVAGKNIVLLWANPVFWGGCFVFCLFTSLVAGSYPALYLSSFQAVKVLKGTFKIGGNTTFFRRTLVVIQFSVSIILIIGTLIVHQQIQFAKNRPMGYNSSSLITVFLQNDEIHKQFDALQLELVSTGAALAVAESSSPPTATWSSTSGIKWDGMDPNLSVDFPFMRASYDFGKTIDWEIIQGRDFSRDFPSDSSAVIINEAALKFMELKDPIGATLRWFGEPVQIIGVVNDLVMHSPYEPARPTIFSFSNGYEGVLVIKANPDLAASVALQKIEAVYKKFSPSQPFDYQFVDESYARKFGNEVRVGKLATAFASLTIFISCLGIFGLASFVAEQRTKEVGIRKVMGASLFNVWQLISREFIILVVLSCFIAMPIGYYLLKSWLSGFTYRAEISWSVFVLSFVGALSITLVTVSTQAIKAAIANPVKSLRSE
jgi:putative ABC transport system permease protein